jgi:hypothetical protein
MVRTFERTATGVIAAFVVASVAAFPSAARAASSSLSIPIVGAVNGGGTFSGVFNLTSFAPQNGQIVASGTLTGLMTNAAGTTTSVVQSVAMPVNVTQSSCQILHLDLGPLSLNLLGLQVNLSEVVLDISAQPGSGNLLGNLLCAVAGLLDNPGGLAKLLNQILAAI